MFTIWIPNSQSSKWLKNLSWNAYSWRAEWVTGNGHFGPFLSVGKFSNYKSFFVEGLHQIRIWNNKQQAMAIGHHSQWIWWWEWCSFILTYNCCWSWFCWSCFGNASMLFNLTIRLKTFRNTQRNYEQTMNKMKLSKVFDFRHLLHEICEHSLLFNSIVDCVVVIRLFWSF